MSFPTDEYTPYGYLDTPAHTRRLNPRGVLRSYDAGFRWHFPAYAGSYGGRRETYRAGFRVAMDGALDLSSFDRAVSPYHSKNLFAFDLELGPAGCRIEYHLVGEHVLCARLSPRRAGRVAVFMEYTRLLAAGGEWGESGLVGRYVDGMLILQGFEDGEAFILSASHPPLDAGITPDAGAAVRWAADGAPEWTAGSYVAAPGQPGDVVTLYGVLGIDVAGNDGIQVLLTRGKTVDEALRQLQQGRRNAVAERARRRAQDDTFWSRAPRLEGDWPDLWRRGLVYDLETVRMMVREPLGIYHHIWDAMQIQSPRVVLAEAAMDALVLGYADPDLAQRMILGTFLDAPAPNVPCSREDGSYNMIAADGSACGTAPEWGYPWLVIDWLAALRPDHDWLERLYPHLAAYLDWWLAHRRDGGGWLVYACSWESGQDESPRFGDQPLGGGHPVRHIRPADLAAAFAHAAHVMARRAQLLGLSHDVEKWSVLAREVATQMEDLWNGERYGDFDTKVGRLTAVDDVMLLAPVALGVAGKDRCQSLRPAIARIDPDSLIWPMHAWTAIEAATKVGMADTAAMLAGRICDRVYRFWDTRTVDPSRTLPGVSCEYWPVDGRCGGEGYGWGAFATHFLLHTLIGITPAPDRLQVCPNLPLEWREPGRRYGLRWHWRGTPLVIWLEAIDADRVRVTIDGHEVETAWGRCVTHRGAR